MFKRFAPALALSLFLFSAGPALVQPAYAQAAPGAQATSPDPYMDMVLAINGGVDPDVMFARTLDELRRAMLAGDPQSAALEAAYPGVLQAMVEAMGPVLRRHSDRLTGEMYLQMAALLADNLTAAEAREAAAFYRSPIGRRVMLSVQNNYSQTAVGDAAVASVLGGSLNISEEAVAADLATSSRAAIRDISAADMATMNRDFASATWPPKLLQLQGEMARIRTAMENAPVNPTDEAEMQQATMAAINRFVAKADAKAAAK